MTKLQTLNSKGFTLIETLIAISILVLAVTGAFAAAQNGVSSASFSKEQIVAFYLAQEGVEEVRNHRDQNGLDGVNWLQGIAETAGDPCYLGNTCMVDALHDEITQCDAGGCPVLKLDGDGFYDYDSQGVDTPFTRSVTLTQIGANEISVVSTVTWTRGIIPRTFKARENIFNWQ